MDKRDKTTSYGPILAGMGDQEARELCGVLGDCCPQGYPDAWDWTGETLAAALGRYGAYLDA